MNLFVDVMCYCDGINFMCQFGWALVARCVVKHSGSFVEGVVESPTEECSLDYDTEKQISQLSLEKSVW